jgi:hypothetical protein
MTDEPSIDLETTIERAEETLERIRDHANSAQDAAMMAQKELDRIQKVRMS